MAIIGSTTFTGTNGTFRFQIERPDGAVEDKVTITFTPKDTVNCKNIRLAQTVKATAYDKRGRVVTKDRDKMYDPPGDRFPWRKGNQVFDADGDAVVIDSLSCEGDPWYNGDDKDKDDASQGSSPPPSATMMDDSPAEGFGDVAAGIHEIVKEFETCAICVDTGECLGCIRWTSSSRRGQPGRASIGVPTGVKPCSGTFQNALERFIKRHTKVDPADKKLKWFCPETDATITGPGGNVNQPFGGEVPEGLKARFLASAEPVRRVGIDRELAGTGRLGAPAEVHGACLADPGLAGVKFTWNGPHDKPMPSVVLTPVERLYEEDISPFVGREGRFALDNLGVLPAPVSEAFLKKLLVQMGPLVQGPGAGPAVVTLLAGMRTEGARGGVVELKREAVYRLLQQAAAHPDVDERLLGTLHYLATNMGRAG